jgi:hypothetical protein
MKSKTKLLKEKKYTFKRKKIERKKGLYFNLDNFPETCLELFVSYYLQ